MIASLRWHAAPRLLWLVPLTLIPALAIWAAAIVESLGLGRPLSSFASLIPATHLGHALELGVTVGGPLLAAALCLLALAEAEVRLGEWEIAARLRLPAPPWSRAQVVAGLLFAIGALLFLAMTGHLAADCVLGGDCPWS